MRSNKYLLLFLFSILSYHSFGQESNASLGVAAIGLVVSDISESEAFYKDIIGMVPAGNFSLDDEWSKAAGAANNRPFSVRMFKMVNRNTATVLKLAYFDETEKPSIKTGIDRVAGVNYLTFYYDSLDDVVKRVNEAGIDILGWVSQPNYQLFFIQDPDGLFVELVGPGKK